jgi:hypothetical protein
MKLDQSPEDLKGVVLIADNIVVHGRTRQEHDQRLHELLIRAKKGELNLTRTN